MSTTCPAADCESLSGTIAHGRTETFTDSVIFGIIYPADSCCTFGLAVLCLGADQQLLVLVSVALKCL